MECVLKVICCFIFCFFASSQKQWYQIRNHDEDIYINLEENELVSSLEDTQQTCARLNSSTLVLWQIPVIQFLGNFINRLHLSDPSAFGM